MKLLLGDVRASVGKMLSMASTDARVPTYINEAQERLIYKGKWPGTYVRYALTNSNGAITWPRQLETIERVAVHGASGVIRSGWYEFLESGPGLLDSDDGDDLVLVDRGDACTFSDIDITDSVNKKLKLVYNTADATKTIILQGYDNDGNWVRSSSGGSIIDGEKFTFDTTTSEGGSLYSITTTTAYQSLLGVIKDETLYNVKLYEVEATGTVTERLIAEYEPTETRPWYRRSLIPGLSDTNTTRTVTVVGKSRFIPAKNDNDWLFINYEAAIKEMVMSIRHAENGLIQEAEAFEARAVKLLEEQLMHYLGDGTTFVPRVQELTASGVDNIQ